MRAVLTYFVTLLVMLPLDAAWLTLTGGAYRQIMGSLLKPQFDLPAAIAFYMVYVFGVTVLVTLPASKPLPAAMRGAVFGFTAYATYDLTALSVIRDWPLSLSLVDMAWGTVLTAVASCVTVWIMNRKTA
ncbi:DUF2177 family protein [Asticcacaulis solisilvae]|uniref:DUF2177 family protein n=1 Tax=Asticcacaulis solisilvae TaxID=1217274 RepID=UPI003FD729A3